MSPNTMGTLAARARGLAWPTLVAAAPALVVAVVLSGAVPQHGSAAQSAPSAPSAPPAPKAPSAPSAPRAPSAPTNPAGTAAADDGTALYAQLCEIVRARNVPGLAVAVFTKDGVVTEGAAGVRVRDGNDAVKPGDRFHLGSCTKAMNATLAALLVADGTLRWDSTVGEVLGSRVPGIHDSWKDVTLRELLVQTSGAQTAPDPAAWKAAWSCAEAPERCRAAFVGAMITAPNTGKRGTFVYSNQGYTLAGMMLEAAAGKPWEQLAQERLFTPLGMRSAGYGPPFQAAPDSPRGHAAAGPMEDSDNPTAVTPAGRVHATMADWAAFGQLHLGATAGPAPGLTLSPEMLKVLHSLPGTDDGTRDGYAMGWGVAHRPWGGRVLTHSGSNTVWYATIWLAPEQGFGVVTACNQGGEPGTRACDDAASAAIQWFLKHRVPPAPGR